MRLESALWTSKQGMDTNGMAVAVVGDNISNSNTTGYRAARTEFSDLLPNGPGGRLAETVDGVGDGSQVSRVRTIHDTGIIEPTGRSLDAGISGGGFFIVGDADAPQYTRNGVFRVDEQGRLTTEAGLPVLGTMGTGTALTELNITNVELGGVPTSEFQAFGNVNSESEVTTPPEDPQTYKDIRASASYVTTQGVYDSLGKRHDVLIAFYRVEGEANQAGNPWVAQAYVDGGDVGGTEGVPVQIGENVNLAFDGTGVIPDASKAAAIINAAPAYSNGANAGAFTINLGSMTQYAGTSLVNNVTQDGVGAGNVSSYEFDSDGKFYAVLDTGSRALIGTVQLATFQNNDGLERSGSSLFDATAAVGERFVGTPGQGLLGDLSGGALERSTVDIAKEYIDLILYQRGYQANTQVFSTAGQMLRDTIQLIR